MTAGVERLACLRVKVLGLANDVGNWLVYRRSITPNAPKSASGVMVS